MINSIQKEVVGLAKRAHKQLWKTGANVSRQTRLAQSVCKAWQSAVKKRFPNRFREEHLVRKGSSEKTDLFDLKAAVAYELKASKNNSHFEFYRDIFKVLIQNKCNPKKKVRRLVFITPKEGAAKLCTTYGDEVRALVKKRHGIEVEIVGI